jgi:hypothetical protein
MEKSGLKIMNKHITGITILAVLLVVMATGAVVGGDQLRDLLSGTQTTAQHTISVNSDRPQMTQAEVRNYIQTMREEYGSESIEALADLMEDTVVVPGISFVGGWTDHLTTNTGKSDNVLLLFRINQSGEISEDQYQYVQWSAARPGPGQILTGFWNRNRMTDSNSRVIFYSPGSAIEAGDPPVPVNLSYGTPGVPLSSGLAYTLHEGIVRPMAGECQVGTGGKFTVEWTGHSREAQVIYGGMFVVTARGVPLISTWDTSLTGR